MRHEDATPRQTPLAGTPIFDALIAKAGIDWPEDLAPATEHDPAPQPVDAP